MQGGETCAIGVDLEYGAVARGTASNAVPYKVAPDKINLANGTAPSLFLKEDPDVAVKLCRFVKPVPSVLTANRLPSAALPPLLTVP
jgi:hypothetical protein